MDALGGRGLRLQNVGHCSLWAGVQGPVGTHFRGDRRGSYTINVDATKTPSVARKNSLLFKEWVQHISALSRLTGLFLVLPIMKQEGLPPIKGDGLLCNCEIGGGGLLSLE